ncbi:MAG: NAD-dependent epimerase/dehydratase family protein [Devosia sp.]
MRFFVTGAAGFIGFHLARRLLADGHSVTGFDAVTDYYDPALKRARLALLTSPNFHFIEARLEDADLLSRAISDSNAEIIVHLAAQAGVRYSVERPDIYVQSNLVGTCNLLEAARQHSPRHLLFASTSSIYGGNQKVPFAETDQADWPMSLYAATKKSGEAMSHSYAQLFGIPTTCFRFFTAYGPWGRPDMAIFKFVAAIESGEPIDVYGHGRMRRDFTYIDDLVEGVVRLVDVVPGRAKASEIDSLSPVAPWRVVNIAGSMPVELTAFIASVERALGKTAEKKLLPMQPGDVTETFASSHLLFALTGYRPTTPVNEGVRSFVEWYRSYERARLSE